MMKLRSKWWIFGMVIFKLLILLIGSEGHAQAIFPEVPEKIDVKANYLFYLHGRIVEIKGIRPISERYGVYEYEKILEALKEKGFIVISEARERNTNPGRYAQKVVSQVKRLLQAGVPPSHITVVGASKGALIAMLVSTILRNRDANFVIMAGCNDMVFQRFDIDLWGNILSIYDEKDELVGSCEKFFQGSIGINKHKEIELKVGTGHGILYKPLKEWIEPLVQWAKVAKVEKSHL
ncbi:MAG: alpha/beta hydrolase [Candidatus Aminicenantes bacterium]|nr:MAG: alpha/beta hydrolase [Candidatus Aminicenantes bacterium]